MAIRCVVFDFDGTLVDSNPIKELTFLEIAASWPGGEACMTHLLGRAARGDRYATFSAFAAAMGCPERAEELARRYTVLCEQRILACTERPGAEAALRRLRQTGVRLHINSATPRADLARIIAGRWGADSVDGVHGAPTAKADNLAAILAAEGLTAAETAVIGDGDDDLAAAAACGCPFIAAAFTPGRPSRGGRWSLCHYDQLDSVLEEVGR